MVGWINGWMDGGMDGWVGDGWIPAWIDRWMDEVGWHKSSILDSVKSNQLGPGLGEEEGNPADRFGELKCIWILVPRASSW